MTQLPFLPRWRHIPRLWCLIRVPCRKRYGSPMSNGLSGAAAPPSMEHLMPAKIFRATVRLAATALIACTLLGF